MHIEYSTTTMVYHLGTTINSHGKLEHYSTGASMTTKPRATKECGGSCKVATHIHLGIQDNILIGKTKKNANGVTPHDTWNQDVIC